MNIVLVHQKHNRYAVFKQDGRRTIRYLEAERGSNRAICIRELTEHAAYDKLNAMILTGWTKIQATGRNATHLIQNP